MWSLWTATLSAYHSVSLWDSVQGECWLKKLLKSLFLLRIKVLWRKEDRWNCHSLVACSSVVSHVRRWICCSKQLPIKVNRQPDFALLGIAVCCITDFLPCAVAKYARRIAQTCFTTWCSSNLSGLGHNSLNLNVSSSGMSSPSYDGLTSTDLGLVSEIQSWRRLVQGITSLDF